MVRYIKANHKVAEYLGISGLRYRLKDGNYILWQNDMLAFGRLTELSSILEQIGGLSLSPYEAKAEQQGTECRTLPVATDPRFVMTGQTAETAAEESAEEESATEEPAETVEESAEQTVEPDSSEEEQA